MNDDQLRNEVLELIESTNPIDTESVDRILERIDRISDDDYRDQLIHKLVSKVSSLGQYKLAIRLAQLMSLTLETCDSLLTVLKAQTRDSPSEATNTFATAGSIVQKSSNLVEAIDRASILLETGYLLVYQEPTNLYGKTLVDQSEDIVNGLLPLQNLGDKTKAIKILSAISRIKESLPTLWAV
jgi:hypothetical protein